MACKASSKRLLQRSPHLTAPPRTVWISSSGQGDHVLAGVKRSFMCIGRNMPVVRGLRLLAAAAMLSAHTREPIQAAQARASSLGLRLNGSGRLHNWHIAFLYSSGAVIICGRTLLQPIPKQTSIPYPAITKTDRQWYPQQIFGVE